MPKKKEEMTPEEHQAVIENMAKIRAMAIAKRQEMAKPKQELKEQRKELRNELIMKEAEKLKKLKQIEEKKEKQIKALDEELKNPLPEFEPPPLAEHQKTKKPVMHSQIDPYNGFGGMGQMFLYEQFREQLKSKYKQKYKEKYAPKPVMQAEPMTNPVADTAKEQLKAKIDAEIKQMAYQSLFGKTF